MDLRIERIFWEEMQGDTSFLQEKGTALDRLFGTDQYSKQEMRETWDRGIKRGIEIGLWKASLEGQRIELYHNCTNENHKEFLDKFYQLAAEYKCAIQYHPELGMVVIER